MKLFEFTVETKNSFDETVAAVEEKSVENGFRVLHTHDVTATLREKGFPRESQKIVEICNARYANEVLNKDVKVAVMLPCPISVYTQEGKTRITTLLPTAIAISFPRQESDVAAEVEKAVLAIVKSANQLLG